MDLEADVQVGDFQIVRRLGAGGMGIVYLARQVTLDRLVALKILGPSLTGPADIARFQREAQAVARLHHPGIAAIYYVGQDRQACYLAMEFVDGLSLRKVIDRLAAAGDARETIESAVATAPPGEAEAPTIRFDEPTRTYAPPAAEGPDGPDRVPLTREAGRLVASRGHLRRCCEIVAEAAAALAHAHGRGVVHRDIKPENLILDRQLHVHVIDFGVARFFEDARMTATGALVGTPMYMSPEQVTGRLEVDHRSDVYSLGLVLYELLSLRRPIAATTREGILRQAVIKPLPPASWRNPAVPRELEAVVHRATAKDPDERYQSAADLAADLRAWLDGRPVTASPYHYRPDVREAMADRPPGVMLAGTWVLFASLYCALDALQGFWVDATTVGVARVGRHDLYMASLGVLYLLAGRGILLGRGRWRWFGIGLSVFNLCLFGTYLHLLARSGRVAGSFWFSVCLTVLASWLATLVTLLRARTRGWFRLVARLRAEHHREPAPG